jgi:hypothetical protein
MKKRLSIAALALVVMGILTAAMFTTDSRAGTVIYDGSSEVAAHS